MKRSDLILKLSTIHPSLTKKDCEKVVDTVFKYMKDKLIVGHRIELRNFGIFSVHTKKGRIALNPRTRERVLVAEKKSIHFKIGKLLFKKINKNFK